MEACARPVDEVTGEEACSAVRPTLVAIQDQQETPLEIVAPDARAAAVAKFRQIADRIESGYLWSARAQWRDGITTIECVEGEGDGSKSNPWQLSLRTYEWKEG